jgi:hypothetical protein
MSYIRGGSEARRPAHGRPDTSTERESDVSDTSLVNVTESAATALGGIDFSASGAGAIRVYFMGFG